MKIRAIAGLGLSALVLGGTMVGCTHGGGLASASSRSDAAAERQAASTAQKASKALAKGDAIRAVSFAEAAVALRPEDAGYRALLGSCYLKAGRFASAHTAFADTLTLSPQDGKAALNLALAQIAEGQWAAARTTLDQHADIVPTSDRGLALALAGDPAAGVDVLVAATRTPGADGKTRQNLALAMALAGRWKEARQIIGVDMAPTDADARIIQWAAFAKPAGAADQVASLLGVTPVQDPGQPVALALNGAVPIAAERIETAMVDTAPALIPTPSVAPAPVPAEAYVQVAQRIVVQPAPARAVTTIASKGAFKTRLATVSAAPVAVRQPAKGDFYVQLGAYDSPGVAKDAWVRAQRRYAAFGAQMPNGMAFTSGAGDFYRLSVGGFARNDAVAMCRTYRARGGKCFVRAGAGDRIALWVKKGEQFAAR